MGAPLSSTLPPPLPPGWNPTSAPSAKAARVLVPGVVVPDWLSPELVAAGFEPATLSECRRLIVSTHAPDKTGKTYFGLTAPDPMVVVNLDIGMEGVIEQFLRLKKRIALNEFKRAAMAKQVGQRLEQREYQEEWKGCRDAILTAISSRVIRTLFIDTGTELWELARLAKFGKLSQVLPQHYSELNSEFRALLQLAYENPNLNLIITHKMKKEYKTGPDGRGNPTGALETAGFGDMPYLVQLNLEHYIHPQTRAFGVMVINSRHRGDLMGFTLEGVDCNFPMLASMVLPHTSLQDWS